MSLARDKVTMPEQCSLIISLLLLLLLLCFAAAEGAVKTVIIIVTLTRLCQLLSLFKSFHTRLYSIACVVLHILQGSEQKHTSAWRVSSFNIFVITQASQAEVILQDSSLI
jgi:hypothetical protein